MWRGSMNRSVIRNLVVVALISYPAFAFGQDKAPDVKGKWIGKTHTISCEKRTWRKTWGGPTCPLCAKSGLLRRGKRYRYSITSSARAITVPGMVMPSSFAVARLMTSSNFVGCSIGNSPGFAPRRILSVYSAARRNMSKKLGP